MARVVTYAAGAAAALVVAGCASTSPVRYVYQDGQYGVIGIPENTSRWPTYYRERAEDLMAVHFPDGFEIVRAEEVVRGTRTLTVEGTNSAEILPQAPLDLVQLGKIGRTSSRTRADALNIEECRIIYTRAGTDAPAPDAQLGPFALEPTLTPGPYHDPNKVDASPEDAKRVAEHAPK